MAQALSFVIITAKQRFYSQNFSLLEGVKSCFRGFRNLFDILFGLSEMRICDYSTKIRDDLKKFLLAELSVDVRF